MGAGGNDREAFENEKPCHLVRLTRGFWLFDTPCTQALWQAVMGGNPSHFKGAERPVENVSWQDCQQFMAKVNEQLPGLRLQLPTEAQWEYACRARMTTARYEDDLDAIAWYDKNSGGETHPVKQKRANAWGLYDMLGNVWEWCHDGLREYSPANVIDPLGPTDAVAYRARRGGYWDDAARYVRAAYRHGFHPDDRFDGIGFRCASSGE
jgi:formylglycine-generating enzyme required for sulfatase activity